ncbi:hypothetical protein [Actinomadura miaoliensis]
MTHSTTRPTRTTVYQYAVIKSQLPDAVIEEMRRAHDCHNALVEIEHRHEQRIADAYAAHPDIASALKRLEDATAAVEAAEKAAAAERQAKRSQKVATETAEAVKAARAHRKEAAARVKELKRRLRNSPEVKPLLREADAQRRAEIKRTYATFTNGGLFWASYNEALSNFQAAVKRVQSDRRDGRPAGLRFRRWDGSGTIAVQLQRASGDRVTIAWSMTRRPAAGTGGGEPERPPVPVTLDGQGDVKTALTVKDTPSGLAYTAEIFNRGTESAHVAWTADLRKALEYADYNGDVTVTGSGGATAIFDAQAGTLHWEGELAGGDPYRSPQVLAAPTGKWRNVARILPASVLGDEERVTVHRGRKRSWDGIIEMRIGSGAYRNPDAYAIDTAEDWLRQEGAALIAERSGSEVVARHARLLLLTLAQQADETRLKGKNYMGTSRAKITKQIGLTAEELDAAAKVLVRLEKVSDLGDRWLLNGVTHQQLVRLPVVIHRPIPEDADVSMLLLTRQRVGATWKAFVSVVANVPAPEPRTEGPLAALHLGWRKLSDGAIRAGVVVGVPTTPGGDPDLKSWLRVHETWAEIVVPDDWQKSWAHYDSLRSIRDRNIEQLRAWLLERFTEHPWLREVLDPEGTLRQWRSPGRFAALALSMYHRPEGSERRVPTPSPDVPGADSQVWEKVARHLEEWRYQDKHLWTWEAHGRRKLVARRKSAYRQIAAWLTHETALVAVDEWSVRDVSRKPRAEDGDDPQMRAARVNRQFASPGLLRQFVRNAAEARGVTVTAPKLTGPAVHHACGGRLDADERVAGIMVWCPSCSRMVDQDVTTARRLAEAAKTSAG